MHNLNSEEMQQLFSLTLRLKGTNKRTVDLSNTDLNLAGKTLGLVNAASWIAIWGDYFGQLVIPEVRLMHICDDSVQLNFMKAKVEGKKVPPDENIERFASHAKNLYNFGADVVMLTCSTMNRSYLPVKEQMAKLNCPVIQIDVPMMHQAVLSGEKVGLIVTLNTSIRSSELLLEEAAKEEGCSLNYQTYVDEEAFTVLGNGDLQTHNQRLAKIIKKAVKEDGIGLVVLAQLSMGVFQFTYPEPERVFGIPVLNSGYTGFLEVKRTLSNLKK